MPYEFGPIAPEELPAFQRVNGQAFGYVPNPEDVEHWRRAIEFERTLAAREDGAIVGSSAAFSLAMTVPGGTALPTAGVTMVGVSPPHRRRGMLTSMMRGLLEDAHRRGEPLAALWASESPIYPRFGFGLAIEDETWEIEREHAEIAHAPTSKGRVRLVDLETARERFPAVWERTRLARPGMTARSATLWDDRFRDPAFARDGGSPYFFALYEDGTAGEAATEGYAIYRVRNAWPDGVPSHEVTAVEVMAATDAAYAALWRYLLSLDLTRTIRAQHRPVDDPLPYMLADFRRLKRQRRDAIWLRLVDTRRALEARRYGIAGRITFEVRDEFCPWNPGRLTLDGGPEGASVDESAAEPDLALAAADLAAAYLGGTRLSVLARAGRVEERRAGALALADAMFLASLAPWCPQFF